MKALDIKEKREKLGLTQEQLAKKVGVSKNTILNYEKGKVIPDSKRELLEQILNNENPNIVNEPITIYKKTSINFEGKIKQIEELIKERREIIKLFDKDLEKINHQEEIIKLLQIRIEIIKEAQTDKEQDL
jgi:transcriptional regulator with XRE-family HTH domain